MPTKTDSGIYCLENIITNQFYIGSSKNINKRINEHLNDLKHDKHGNSHLQRSYNKYGENSFVYSILEYVDNINNLISCEQYWVNYFTELKLCIYNQKVIDVTSPIGYRHTQEAKDKCRLAALGVNIGRKHSQKTREKMSKAKLGNTNMLGKQFSNETRRKIAAVHEKPVAQIDKNTNNVISVWPSATIAAQAMNGHQQNISAACNGKVKTAYGNRWQYIAKEGV